jgi:hypothetical protein
MAHERLDAFLTWIGWSDSELARRVPCHQTYARGVRRGEKRAGLVFAVAVERLTTEFTWPDGPIRAAEWVSVESKPAA